MKPHSLRHCSTLFLIFAAIVPLGMVTTFAAGLPSPLSPVGTASADDPASLFAAGLRYLKGDGVEKDEKRAFELIRRAAELGNGEALGALGYFYSVGLVVEKNDTEARRYFELGSERASAKAQLNLGRFLIDGRGGPKDPPRGINEMEKAVAQGLPEARLILGEIFFFGDHADQTPDYQRSYEVLIDLAQAGQPRAQNMIGVMRRDGRVGKPDAEAARGWFEKAARQGDPKACSNLGHLLDRRSKDRAVRLEALQWLLVAQDLKEVTATYTFAGEGPAFPADELKAAQEMADAIKKDLPSSR